MQQGSTKHLHDLPTQSLTTNNTATLVLKGSLISACDHMTCRDTFQFMYATCLLVKQVIAQRIEIRQTNLCSETSPDMKNNQDQRNN